LIQIQWFVVIACAYLIVIQDGHLAQDIVSHSMLIAPLTSMLIFLRLPEAVFMHRFFPQTMAIVDTILISTAIVFNRESPWDLFLVFFFGILVAAIGENLLQIIGGCLVVGVLSLVVVRSARPVAHAELEQEERQRDHDKGVGDNNSRLPDFRRRA
jgi:hypothetical protein